MNPKQQKFVDEYLIDRNATQAAIRAGYSRKGARVQGQRLLKRPDVAAAVAEVTAQQHERDVNKADLAIGNFVEAASFHPKLICDEDGKLLPMHQWPPEAVAGIAGFKVTTNSDGDIVTDVRFTDRLRATESLAKIFGPQVAERIEISGPNGRPIQAESYDTIEIARHIAFALAKGLRAAGQPHGGAILDAETSEVVEPAEVEPPRPDPFDAISHRIEINLAERLPGGRERWAVVERNTGQIVRDCASESAARDWAIATYRENGSD